MGGAPPPPLDLAPQGQKRATFFAIFGVFLGVDLDPQNGPKKRFLGPPEGPILAPFWGPKSGPWRGQKSRVGTTLASPFLRPRKGHPKGGLAGSLGGWGRAPSTTLSSIQPRPWSGCNAATQMRCRRQGTSGVPPAGNNQKREATQCIRHA